MTPITLQEPFRALCYAPFYAALSRRAFNRHGVAVVLTTARSPDQAVTALLAGEADLAWSGPMRVILEHARDPASPLLSFCPVVMRDPFCLLGRAARPGFTLHDLVGLRLGIVREVPTPWWCLQQDLREAGIDPDRLTLVTGRSMADNAAALLRGELDAAQLFEPHITAAERAGAQLWYAAASRGPTAYSTFYAPRANLAAKRNALAAMQVAMADTLAWMATSTGEAIAEAVLAFFPRLERGLAAAALERYRRLGIWADGKHLPRVAFDRLESSLLAAGAIATAPGFAACIAPDFVA